MSMVIFEPQSTQRTQRKRYMLLRPNSAHQNLSHTEHTENTEKKYLLFKTHPTKLFSHKDAKDAEKNNKLYMFI